MRKVTCTVQKQQSVFERLLVMDCQKHSLEHCLIGLSGCQQQKRTLDTVTNQKLIFGVFFFTSLLFSAEQVLSRSTFSARGGGGGCDRTLRTPPPPQPTRLLVNPIDTGPNADQESTVLNAFS